MDHTSKSLGDLVSALPQLENKASLMRHITSHRGLPQVVRTAALSLALVSDSDFAAMRDTFVEIVSALDETPRGRALLLDMGLERLWHG